MCGAQKSSAALAVALTVAIAAPAAGQHDRHAADSVAAALPEHQMWSVALGRGWMLRGMAQAIPAITFGAPFEDDGPLRATGAYLTQSAVMGSVESPGAGWTVRTTLNFEGVTQPDGELAYGGWGEGFLDRRHPHTLLHELMVSANAWGALGGALSLSAGKGFAPFGTDDPMSRPGLKYPTNHHLSQILERWTVNAVYVRDGWSVEAGVFGGAEPDGPYDMSNIESFGDSWSVRAGHRWGGGAAPPLAAWEASASFGSVAQDHHGESTRTRLWNAAVRHASLRLYTLFEASISDPQDGDGFYSVLGEARLTRGRHRPYARLEVATRPEYARDGDAADDGFFRYDHDQEPIGATRWIIATAGYGVDATRLPVSIRPFAEAQYHRVAPERGGIAPHALFGADSFWTISFGARLFFGGGPMRMGAYGVLDPMTALHHSAAMPAMDHVGHDRQP